MDILSQCNMVIMDLDEHQRMLIVTQDDEVLDFTEDVAIKYRAQYHTKETGERIKMGFNIYAISGSEERLLGTYDGMIEIKQALSDLFIAFLTGQKVFKMPEGGDDE